MAVGAGPGDPHGPGGGGGVPAGPGAREPLVGETGIARRALDINIADPGPLGLAAFAMTTFVLSMFNGELVAGPAAHIGPVLALALFYGGATQLLAGMWEFRKGNTFGAVAFSSYGAFWMSLWAIFQFYSSPTSNPLVANDSTIALYLAAWGIFTLYMTIASLRTTAAIALVFALLTPTYGLLAAGFAGGHETVINIGGYVGIATAAAAWYASFAAVTNSTFGKTVLPVIPLRRTE